MFPLLKTIIFVNLTFFTPLSGLISTLPTVSTLFSIENSNTAFSSDTNYGGSASVTVEYQRPGYPENGRRRVLNETVSCDYSTVANAKSALSNGLRQQKGGYEEFVSDIKYDISSCED